MCLSICYNSLTTLSGVKQFILYMGSFQYESEFLPPQLPPIESSHREVLLLLDLYSKLKLLMENFVTSRC